jgi:DNA-binding response OmpR family regulator
MKILLLEDDEILNEVISSFLIKKGYQVCSTYDGEEAEDELYKNNFDLLLLDVNVPNINGFELLKNLRTNNINTPAIFLTSLNDTEDLKEGFLSGCDDYIKKPFEFEELDLRIENIKRLYKIETNFVQSLSQNSLYNFNECSLHVKGKKYTLSKKESQVLEYFLKNKHRTISIEEIGVNIWSYEDKPTDSTIRTYIKNLRKILEKDIITTIKGIGYRFN